MCRWDPLCHPSFPRPPSCRHRLIRDCLSSHAGTHDHAPHSPITCADTSSRAGHGRAGQGMAIILQRLS